MHDLELQEFLRRTPFEQFRTHLSDGSHFVIRHPECVLLGKRQVAIEGLRVDAIPVVAFCDPVHVTHLELLRASPPSPAPLPPA
jgi:hypothetical protein